MEQRERRGEERGREGKGRREEKNKLTIVEGC
jgi:hypothetical protein